MKQTVEEAAKEYWDSWLKNNPNADKTRIVSLGFAFKAGAEWQSKQSPWISVKERLPENNTVVLTRGLMASLFASFHLWVNGKLEQMLIKKD